MPDETRLIPVVGMKALAFSLFSDSGGQVRLTDLRGTPICLYFYPKDNTPGCTLEANEFRKKLAAFKRLGVRVIGVSPDSVESHEKFVAKLGLKFSLLSDAEHKVAKKYGVWVEKNLYGRKYWGVQRATFLIDASGKFSAVWPKVKPQGHAAEVLAAAKLL